MSLIWQDTRLIYERVDNKTRLLQAAEGMFNKLAKYVDPKMIKKELRRRGKTMQDDLNSCIGGADQANTHENKRIVSYRELAQAPEYGGRELASYDAQSWMDEVVNEAVRGQRDRSGTLLSRLDPFVDFYRWKDRKNYKQTHWYRFQEAVKAPERNLADPGGQKFPGSGAAGVLENCDPVPNSPKGNIRCKTLNFKT